MAPVGVADVGASGGMPEHVHRSQPQTELVPAFRGAPLACARREHAKRRAVDASLGLRLVRRIEHLGKRPKMDRRARMGTQLLEALDLAKSTH